MINQDVLTYIRGQIALGVSREAIKKSLATGGWTEGDMQEAFAAIDGVKTPPPPPPPPPRAEPPQQAIRPPVTSSGVSMQGGAPLGMQRTSAPPGTPIGMPPQQRPVPSISTISSAPVQKRKSSSWPLFVLLFILLLVAGGVAAYFLYPDVVREYVPFVGMQDEMTPPPEPPNLFEQTPGEESPVVEDPFATSTATTTPNGTATSTATTTLQATTTIPQ